MVHGYCIFVSEYYLKAPSINIIDDMPADPQPVPMVSYNTIIVSESDVSKLKEQFTAVSQFPMVDTSPQLGGARPQYQFSVSRVQAAFPQSLISIPQDQQTIYDSAVVYYPFPSLADTQSYAPSSSILELRANASYCGNYTKRRKSAKTAEQNASKQAFYHASVSHGFILSMKF